MTPASDLKGGSMVNSQLTLRGWENVCTPLLGAGAAGSAQETGGGNESAVRLPVPRG
jgi:hypothetical protein